jgi:hypothetical protein
MKFKINLIILLVFLNLLFLFILISKKEGFKPNALIQSKSKIHIKSDVLLQKNDKEHKVKQKANLFIDGDLEFGSNDDNEDAKLCFGENCYSSKNITNFLAYDIPYEVFETDPVEQKIPDKLCFMELNDTGMYEENCITGDDLKMINGKQAVYIGGPNYDESKGSKVLKNEGKHLRTYLGKAPHYYYDINENYFENMGMKHKDKHPKEELKFDEPDCKKRGDNWDPSSSYGPSGINKVPYFFNITCNGIHDEGYHTKYCQKNDQAKGVGILQMIKHPVHTANDKDFDSIESHKHRGNQVHKGTWGRCSDGFVKQPFQENQLMNVAAVNMLPRDVANGKIDITGHRGLNLTDSDKQTKEKIKYLLTPGDSTGLRCVS